MAEQQAPCTPLHPPVTLLPSSLFLVHSTWLLASVLLAAVGYRVVQGGDNAGSFNVICTSQGPSLLSVQCRVNAISNAAAGSPGMLSTGLMARSRLRRGCQCHAVHSVLYVGLSQGCLDSANNAGQVTLLPDQSARTKDVRDVSPGFSFLCLQTAVLGVCCVHM